MKTNKKIVIINRHRDDTIGGSELQCDLIASELSQRGYSVVYIVPGGKGPYERERGYNIIACENTGQQIAKVTISQKPDIVYWRYNKRNFYEAAKLINKSSLPIIFSSSSERDVKRSIHKKDYNLKKYIKLYIKNSWNRRGFKFVDAVVVNNISHLNLLPISCQKFIPNGMLSSLTPFKWDKPYCAWISSLKQIKRPELIPALAKEFENQGIDFLMVGEIQEDKYKWFEQKANLPANVHYLGVKTPEEVNGILKGAELHIHTCYPEGFPNVFIQAWAQATPSISLGFDPSGYILKHQLGDYANNDFKKFAQAVKAYLNDRELRNKTGNNARVFAHSMFNTAKSVDMLEEVFKQVNSSEGYQLKVKKQGIPLT